MELLATSEIRIYMDGDRWCALIGLDLAGGICGWGDSPIEALECLLKMVDQVPMME